MNQWPEERKPSFCAAEELWITSSFRKNSSRVSFTFMPICLPDCILKGEGKGELDRGRETARAGRGDGRGGGGGGNKEPKGGRLAAG